MAILDKPLRKVATRLIKQFGTTVTLIRRGAPSYNIQTGTSVESVTEYAVKAVIEDYKARELQEGLVKVGDRKVLIASADLTFEPQPSDQIVFDGITHNIISIQQFYSGDQSAIFSCQVRR
jgi:hypothetical protein